MLLLVPVAYAVCVSYVLDVDLLVPTTLDVAVSKVVVVLTVVAYAVSNVLVVVLLVPVAIAVS